MSFAMDFITKLQGKLSDEELKMVCQELEVFSTGYDISERCTKVALADNRPECYKVFFVAKKMKGCSDGTLLQYKLQLDLFFDMVQKPIEEITTEDIITFLYILQVKGRPNHPPMNPNVVDGIRRILNSFFSWAVNGGYLKTNPVSAIDKIRGEKKQRQPLTEIEIEKVRYSIDNAQRNSKGYKRGLDIRNMALFEFLFSTGARVSEVENLNRDDVNFETREVHLFGKGKKHRISYMNAKAIIYLSEYLQSRDDDNEALFVSYKAPHKRLSKAGIRRVLKVGGDIAGVGRIFPHRIRHTTATIALNHGMRLEEVQKLLGHEKPETTMIYAKLCQENVKNSHLKYVI